MTLHRAAEYNELRCDWPECDEDLTVFDEYKRTIRARARGLGWVTRRNGQDYCPRHANGMLAA